jgi:Ca2+-dependent lipid-binding protein
LTAISRPLDTAWSEGKGLDPYVVIDFGKQIKTTKVQDTLNPIWNETYVFDCKDGASMFTIFLKDKEKLQKWRLKLIHSLFLNFTQNLQTLVKPITIQS